MNFNVTNEQKLLQENLINFCKEELNTNVNARDRSGTFSRELWVKCAQQGLTGLPVDKKYGGAGLDNISTVLALEAFGYGCDDGGLSFSVAAHLLATVIPFWKYGSNDQKEQFLHDLCTGKKIGANAITEKENGSDVFNMQTRATEQNNHYTINGRKLYITNGSVADVILVYALTDEEKGFYGGITPFIIPCDTKGFSAKKNLEKMGLKTCKMSELVFDNVSISSTNVLCRRGSGSVIFQHSMEWERVGMAALHVGIMQRLLEQIIEFTKARIIQEEPLSKKQVIAHRISDIKVRLEAARMLTYRAATGLDTDRNNTIHTSVAKLFVSEAYVKTATECLQIYGASGYIIDTGIERIVRDSMASTLYSGTSEIQKNIISKFLGL
jgi:alkylation response protein AidB-like acyl-CoA dehydrogenase